MIILRRPYDTSPWKMVKKDNTLAQKGAGPARHRKRACKGSFTKTAHRLHLLQLDAKDNVATTVVAQATSIGKVGQRS